MLQSRAVSWVNENRLLAAGVALFVIAAAVTYFIVTDSDNAERLADPPAQAETTDAPKDASATEAPDSGGTERGSARVSAPGAPTEGSVLPGVDDDGEAAPCTPKNVSETGVTRDSITIGQIVTDSNQIPQQFKPAHEGLQAFVKLFNKSGGLCKRMLNLEYRNDNLNPAIHAQDVRELAERSLAFVGNESVLDQLDYEGNPPFDPQFEGGGGHVPDVGGLAFSYARSQSSWHAGVIGSVSPVLVGGGNYKFYQSQAKAKGKPCTKGGVVYLQEPTGASEDQARVGQVSLEASWGMNLGSGNTKLYPVNLVEIGNVYDSLVGQMRTEGMDCVFAYTDLRSSVQLAKAMAGQAAWPPSKCTAECFNVFYVPLSAYDEKFIKDAGDASLEVSTFVPHVPLNEGSNEGMRIYLDALKAVPGARPSTFSVLGFASGVMFVEALQACPEAPTRECLMSSLRKMKDFTAGGLLGGTTPFRTTKATFDRYGTFDWKWIFNHSVTMRVADRNGKRDFYRINPKSGFFEDTLRVARGTPG